MMKRQIRLEWVVLLYFLTYTPYAVITKLLTTVVDAKVGRPLTGLEILPFSLLVSSVFILLFLAISGWWRVVPRIRIAGIPVFAVRPAMWVAGIGAAMLLISVPMSYTFPKVSIPTVQLLMRGDVLLIAPIVDMVTGRKVRWYSWLALALVAVALVMTVRMRGGFDFPATLIAIVVIYTIGYFLRLAVMTRVAKSDDAEATKRYFVEERIVSIPIAIGVLALVATNSGIAQGRELAWGFTQVWTSAAVPLLLIVALCLFLITFFAAMVLLDRRENTYCVPLERSASLLAGTAAAFVLAIVFGAPFPKSVEIFGAAVMIVAVSILAIGPMLKNSQRL